MLKPQDQPQNAGATHEDAAMAPRKNAAQSLLAASAVIFSVGMIAAHDASAQTASAQQEEIVVTVQKRTENLQETPASISVISGSAIENSGAINIEGLTAQAPSLNFRKGGTSLNSSLFLRGVGTINFSIAAEPSVATVLDGVVLPRAGEAFGDLVDIERIEVLRGPQGTLFGKNASAGVVNVITRAPGDTLGATIDLSAFEGEEYRIRVAADLPISEQVKTRVTAFAGSYEGNIDNLATGGKVNGYDRWGIRGVAVIEATPQLDFKLIADYRKADDECCAEVIGTAPAGANGAALRTVLAGVPFLGDETRTIRQDFITSTIEEAWGLSAEANYDLAGGYTLTSITAYRQWDNTEIRDGDWLDRVGYLGNGNNSLHDRGPQESTTFTQEIRIASPETDRGDWIAGLYFSNNEAERTFRRDVTVCTASTLAPDATGVRPCTPAASTFTSVFSSATFGSEAQSLAAFVDGKLNLTEQFALIGGLRATRDELSYFHNRIPSPIAAPGLRTDTSGFRGSTENTNTSGRVGAKFQAADNILAYATYTRGYKGPAYNVFFNMNPTGLNVIEPEEVDAYEAGLKMDFFQGGAVLNLTAFKADYTNFQANNFDTLNGVIITRLTNAGEVSTTGFEADWLLRPTRDLTITGGYAYTDAQVENFITPAGQVNAVRPGSPLALSPKSKASIGAEYFWEPGFAPVNVTFGGSYSYTSEQFSDLGQNPLLRISPTTLVDASISISDKSDKYRLTLIGKNLTDESFTSLITPGGPGGALRYLIPREADRYFGVSLRAKLGS